MDHLLFKDDEVSPIEDGSVEVAIAHDNGADFWYRAGETFTIERVEGDQLVALWQPDGGDYVDIEVYLRAGEFIHDHAVCEDALENIRGGDSWKWYSGAIYWQFETFS